ncbi:MAG: sulfurtransferase [Gammaproteobacteria bacterium]
MSHETLISARTLAGHLDRRDWRVFDCRFSLADPSAGERAYGEGHIAGARYAHLDRDLSGPVTAGSGRHPLPDVDTFLRRLRGWGVGNDTQVVVYDDVGGAVAARLWWLLRWVGHGQVAVLDGGIDAWRRTGGGLATATPAGGAGDLEGAADDQEWLSSVQVQGALADDFITLVDARGAERFRGEEEPIDPVAGHVPGAVSRPYALNLGRDGRFLEPGELLCQFQQLCGAVDPREVVHMCGSGVTACHNLLAMEHAGLHGSRLYAGSWSEWIRDPARPVARGEG